MATVTHAISTASTSNATTYASGAFTPVAGDLLVVFVRAGATTATGTMTGSTGLTFTKVDHALFASSAHRVYCFVSNSGAAASSQTVTFDCTGDTADGAVVHVLRVNGMGVFGASAVRQSAKTENNAGGGAPVATFASAAQSGNPTMGCVGNGANPATLTPPTNWAEASDTGYGTPTSGSEVVHRSSGFTTSTITWGSTSASAFGVLTVELNALPQAQFNVTTTPKMLIRQQQLSSQSRAIAVVAAGVLTISEVADENVSVAITASSVVIANTSADEDVSVAITASGGLAGQFTGTADRTVSAGITASGALAGQATRAETVTITATATAVGQADQATTVGITTSGALVSQAAASVTVGITASGVLSLATSASETITAGVTASGQLVGAPSGTATVAVSVDVTASGQLLVSSTATRASTVGITASGALIVSKAATEALTVGLTSSGGLLLSQQADRVETVTLTATGLFTGSSNASQDSTVGITATGSLILFGAASISITADIITVGSGGLRYSYRPVDLGTTPRPDNGTTPRVLTGVTYRP